MLASSPCPWAFLQLHLTQNLVGILRRVIGQQPECKCQVQAVWIGGSAIVESINRLLQDIIGPEDVCLVSGSILQLQKFVHAIRSSQVSEAVSLNEVM